MRKIVTYILLLTGALYSADLEAREHGDTKKGHINAHVKNYFYLNPIIFILCNPPILSGAYGTT